MAFTGNTTSNLSELMQSYYDKLLLKRVSEVTVMDQLGQMRPLPKHEGKTITFSRYSNLSRATTALQEGTNPTGSNLSATNVTAQVAEYGDFIKISSLVSLTALDPKLAQKIPILGTQFGETIEDLIITEVAPNATAQVVSTSANLASITATDVLAMVDIRKGVRTLKKNKAMKFNDGYWVCTVAPDTTFDLQNDSLWTDSAVYKDNTRLYRGEIGKWYGVRFVEGTLPYRSSVGGVKDLDSGAVFWNLLMGKEAFGITKLDGAENKVVVKNSGPQDTSNPLNRFSTAGWYCTFVPKVLNANFVVAIQTGATA